MQNAEVLFMVVFHFLMFEIYVLVVPSLLMLIEILFC